jgi:hypothetical protein
MAKLSDVLEELCQDNGDIRSVSLLYPNIICDKNKFLFERDDFEYCILIKDNGYVSSVSIINKSNMIITEFSPTVHTKNISNIVRLLKGKRQN